ncbi:MAG TPA: hypothetical protein VK422_13425 [Pyrinomonadaceae bacterium]|nr:hypothetical protein [Pyrinomonadaceae bacterium]
MRKTLFSVLPLVVFLGPISGRLPLLFGVGVVPAAVERAEASARNSRRANPAAARVRDRVAEARRALEKVPAGGLDSVTLAAGEAKGGLHLVTLAKEDFLEKGAEISAVSLQGEPLKVTVVRPNYVNTAVRVTDAAGRELEPLAVRYPVERDGKLKEVAYYTSAHPAVESAAVSRAGGEYIREGLDAAAARLASKGIRVSPEIIDAAERLCHVEHADHKRFMTEDSAALFNEVRALYALNAGDTYRYSVSSAGAGGMVQMIPPTYKGVREQHPRVGLKEDFVEGMRDHSNALQAMLLYMQDTWDVLLKSEEVKAALRDRIATQPELLAAGYNSNPYKLPKYIARGGSAWRTLIPEETKMYLRIYAAVERTLEFKDRS